MSALIIILLLYYMKKFLGKANGKMCEQSCLSIVALI